MSFLPWKRPHSNSLPTDAASTSTARTDPALIVPEPSPEAAAEAKHVQEVLWTTFPGNVGESWTLALGDTPGQPVALSPPLPAAARLRCGSDRSLSYFAQQEREGWPTTRWGSSGPPSPVSPRLRRATSAGGSSAGGSSDGVRFKWKQHSRTPSTPSSPNSHQTFGQSGSSGSNNPRKKLRPSSSSEAMSFATGTGSPTPASLSTQMSRTLDSDTSSLREDLRTYQEAGHRSAVSPKSARVGRSEAGPSLRPAKSFSEESWEFQVAKNLYLRGPGSARHSSTPDSSSQESPFPAPTQRQLEKSKASTSPKARKTSLPLSPGGVLPFGLSSPKSPLHESTSREARRDQVPHSSPPSPVRLLSPPVTPRRQPSSSLPPVVPPQVPRRDSIASVAESLDSEMSWHSAEDDADLAELDPGEDLGNLEEQPFEIKPSRQAAVSWSSTGTERPSATRNLFSTIFPLSPPLTPSEVIDHCDSSDPFADDRRARTPTQDDWSAVALDDDDRVVFPLPAAPIKSPIPQTFLHSPPNFLSATPRELRAAWRREQRTSLTTRGPSPIHEERLSVERRHSWTADTEQRTAFLPPSPITPISPTTPSARAPPLPEHHHHRSSFNSSLASKQNPFLRVIPRPLLLVPMGAYLFIFGFVCPPLWWIGALFPRPVEHSLQQKTPLTEVRVERHWGPMTEWPDRREGAREPTFDGSRGSGRISKALEGPGEWWETGTGWRASQQSILTWRRRNRM